MTLPNSSDTSEPDPFPNYDYTPDNDTTAYPPVPSLAPFSFLLGYNESDRTRYINLQSTTTSRHLNLDLTPSELSAQNYYDSIFYTYESYGDLLGTTSGLLLGSALRNRKPGRIPTAIARAFGQTNPKAARLVAIGLRLVTFGALGRLYGLTSAGVQALNRMRAEQKQDPVMARIVAARAKKMGALEKEVRARAFGQHREPKSPLGDEDEQSLGGMEIADQQRRTEEANTDAENQAFPFGRPSEKVAQLEQRAPVNNQDPFFDSPEREEVPQQRKGGWKNTHSSTTESTWERLRRGQSRAPSGGDDAPQSPWPQRAPMEGLSSPSGSEPKTDSFSFSKTAEERELAKAQAQKEFDESVERERRSGGGDGDGYSEGDKGGRGKW